MAEFDDNQTAVEYGESLLASRANQQKKNKKRQKKIERAQMVLAGVSIADKFMAKNAQKKVETFTNNLNAEKARELSNYKQASDFNTQLETYRKLDPSINFEDELQYAPKGLIYDAVQTKHAKDTRSQYAKGLQGSFQEATTDGVDASSDWEEEVKRRTENSMIALKASYNKYKGYLNTTDVAIKSQYKQILDQGTNDLMSADNTSSIRKLLNKFGITDKNNAELTNIEAGGIKMKVNVDLAKDFNAALKNNDAATKTYNTWLKSKDKGYDTTVTEMKPLNTDEKKQIARFNSFTKAANGFHGNFYYSEKGVLNKNTFAQADSRPIKDFEKAEDSQGEQPLAQMTLEGVTGPRNFSDLWGKLSGDQRRILLDNSEMLYGRELSKEQKILKDNAPIEGAVGQATGSPEQEVDAMVAAIKATVSFNDEGKYEVKKLLVVEEFNRTTSKEESIEKYESEGFLLQGGKNTTQMANSYFNIHKNPTLSVEQKKDTLANLRTQIGAQGEAQLNHFNEVIEEHGINFDTTIESDKGLSNVISPRELFSGEFNQQYGLFPSIYNKFIQGGSPEQKEFRRNNPKLDTSLVDIAGLGSMFGGDGVKARDFLIDAMEDALPDDASRLKAIDIAGVDKEIKLTTSQKKVKLIDKKGHITWNGSQFNQEGTVAVPLLGAEGSGREMEYKDIPESPLKELIKQKAVSLYADNFRIGKRIIGVSEDGKQYLINYGTGSIIKEDAPAWLLSNSTKSAMNEKKKMMKDNTIRTGRTEPVSKLINAHITAKKDNGTPRFLITDQKKAIDNLLNKFLPAVIQIESSGDPKAKSSQSSASGLLQFLMPSKEYPNGSAIPALNRVEKYLGKREWGEELRKHGDASLLTAEQQVELFIGNILEKTVVIRDLDADGNIQYNKKGKILTKEVPGLGDKLMQKVFDGDMEGMLEAYYMIHHTNPDEATIKVAEREFKKYF